MLQILINLSWLKTETLEKSLQIAEVGFFLGFSDTNFSCVYTILFIGLSLGESGLVCCFHFLIHLF